MIGSVLVGRSTERAALRAALDDARRGGGGPSSCGGPPASARRLCSRTPSRERRGFRVLRTRSTESEAGLAFAGLSDLVAPVLERLPAVPAAAARRPPRRSRAGAARCAGPLRRLRRRPEPDRGGRGRLAGADRPRRRPLARRADAGGAGVLRPPHRGRADRHPGRLARAGARAVDVPDVAELILAPLAPPADGASCSRRPPRARRSPRLSRARSSPSPRATRSPSSSSRGR